MAAGGLPVVDRDVTFLRCFFFQAEDGIRYCSRDWSSDVCSSDLSINNVVDATNYILFELNQPLHAFDLAKLRGPAVVVRRARPGAKIVRLAGARAGGGAGTKNLVLECAYFQPTRIRRTRRALELSSESSYRFERGIDMLGRASCRERV